MKRFIRKSKYLILLVMILGVGITGCMKKEAADSASSGKVTDENKLSGEAVICDDFSCINGDIWAIAIPIW